MSPFIVRKSKMGLQDMAHYFLSRLLGVRICYGVRAGDIDRGAIRSLLVYLDAVISSPRFSPFAIRHREHT